MTSSLTGRSAATLSAPLEQPRKHRLHFCPRGGAGKHFSQHDSRRLEHWWDAAFKRGPFKSKQPSDATKAEMGKRKVESSKGCQTVHKDEPEVFDSSALPAAAPAAAE